MPLCRYALMPLAVNVATSSINCVMDYAQKEPRFVIVSH
jgi:hypothetical protein